MNSIATVMLRLYSGLSIAGVLVCVLLMGLTFMLNQRLNAVLAKTITAQNAVALSRSIREQYIHELHGLVYSTSSHQHHHGQWVDDAAAQIRSLKERAPRSVAWRAERVGQLSNELDQLFENRLLPAALRGDDVAVTTLHAEAHALSETAVAHADTLAAFLSDEAQQAYRGTLWVARIGFAAVVLGGVLLLWMFLAARRRLTDGVLTPLENFARHVDSPQTGDPKELAVLRNRLGALRDVFTTRKTELVREQRLAVLGKLCGRIAEVLENDLEQLSQSVAILERVHESIPSDEVKILSEEVETCRRLADDLSTWRQRPSLEFVTLEMSAFVEDMLERVPGVHMVDVEHCELVVDRMRIRQIVLNVVRNASQVAPEQPIRVRGRIADDSFRLEIEDAGPGLPAELLAHVFEPFFTTRSGGTGLGLAISRELALAHGGTLEFDNSPMGAVVTLTLPIR